ncbi:MAG: NAD-dependent epimerase/dehydratase family protein [Deltaproteobacteria bacterium]|nr:NAD-dependent epimerase/dehydratase family protein [Deltaproteobacteria bacterium]
MKQARDILVTGGAGYIGAVLAPKLLAAGHRVRVLDLYIYGGDVLDAVGNDPNLTQIKGDLRDHDLLEKAVAGCDTVIHLACISNDPSYELDPVLGKSINYDAFVDLVGLSCRHGVRRFVYASSSSVYGIKEEAEVTEDLPLEPRTDYSKYKALCEEVLLKAGGDGFVPVVVRPATVCGYSPRQRLDVIVNILTNHAVNNKKIKVFGGEQKRPNLHIEDMTDLYLLLMDLPDAAIDGQVFNAGYQNHKVKEIAGIVREVIGQEVEIVTEPTDDDRSYHVSSAKIERELGFRPKRTIEDAVREMREAFEAGKLPDSMTDPRYFNIKMMQQIKLK